MILIPDLIYANWKLGQNISKRYVSCWYGTWYYDSLFHDFPKKMFTIGVKSLPQGHRGETTVYRYIFFSLKYTYCNCNCHFNRRRFLFYSEVCYVPSIVCILFYEHEFRNQKPWLNEQRDNFSHLPKKHNYMFLVARLSCV